MAEGLLFVSKQHDDRGKKALEVLQSLGQRTRLLEPGEECPVLSIALFTPRASHFQGSGAKFLRCSAIGLTPDLTPEWVNTPFRVGVIRTQKEYLYSGKRSQRNGFEEALRTMARSYEDWFSSEVERMVPWAVYEKDPSIKPNSRCVAKAREWLVHPAVSEMRRTWVVKKRQPEFESFPLGGWQVNYMTRQFVFPASAQDQAIKLLERWRTCFPTEDTWVRNSHGLPSLFVRFDCIVRNGQLIVYEIEERPAGLGISGKVNPEFAKRLVELSGNWPQFGVEVSPNRQGTDDPLWLAMVGWESKPASGLVLVRAEPEEAEFHQFEPRSVSSLKAKGDKSYGEQMGLWRKVTRLDELQWNKCFVLKPLQGSKLRDLEIWDPVRRPGSSARAVVEASLKKNGAMFCQQLHEPMPTGIAKFPWMIFRVFFGYDPKTASWMCLGGNWNARHNLRIHGASDAIFGPAVVG